MRGYEVRGMECSVQSALYGTWDEVFLELWSHAFYRSCNTNFQSIVFKKMTEWLVPTSSLSVFLSCITFLMSALQLFLGGFAK